MTSARGQNVSVLHFHGSVEPWDPPITTFTDSGGSLRTAPRSNNYKIERNGLFVGGKSSGHCFVENSSSECHGKGFASSKGFNVTMTSVESSPAVVSSANRELSPVRWCDREVDGVYLGKSGWVQVHQKPSNNGNKSVTVSTLPSRVNFPDFYSVETNRPSYLPLPMKKRGNRENRERPCDLFQDVDSTSPPSLTPIISPPPAFKDRGLEVQFQIPDNRKPFSGKSSLLLRSNAVEEFGKSFKSRERWDALDSPSSGFSMSSAKHHSHLPRMSQTKSLDDTYSMRRREEKNSGFDTPLTFFGFHSLDSEVDPIRFNKGFENHERNYNGRNEDENDECYQHLLRLRNSPREVPAGQKTFPKSFRHRNLQRHGRRISGNEFLSTSKYKERSLDSSTSSSGSNCSSPERISPSLSSRKYYPKQSQQSLDSCFTNDGKHFNVKRSRSLQLSEKRSPNDLMLMTHSSSGKSWDQMPSEYSTVADRSQNNVKRVQQQSPQPLAFKANGSLTDESLLNLNYRRAEEKRMKEADKEVRIITEFLNGTRSRAAARNLLLHRYLNKPEDEDPVSSPMTLASESEHGIHFLSMDRKPKTMFSHEPDETLSLRTQSRDRQFYSLSRDYRHRADTPQCQPYSLLCRERSFGEDSGRLINAKISQTCSDPTKAKKTERKSSVAICESSNETDWKKHRAGRRYVNNFRPLTPNGKPKVVTSHQLSFHEQKGEKCKNKMKDVVIKKANQSAGSESDVEERGGGRRSDDDSSSASSWSSDFWRDCSPAKIANARKSSGSVTLVELVCTSPGLESNSRPGSAPANDDFATRGIDQRSLSLPRSFLSDIYGFHNSDHGSPFPNAENFHKESKEWSAINGSARTAPATPVDELRDDRKKEKINETSSVRSSTASVASEPLSLTKPQFVNHKLAVTAAENLVTNGNLSLGTTSRNVLQKFKKNFSSKFARSKRVAKANDQCNRSEKECESEKESSSAITSDLIFDFQDAENDDKVSEAFLRGSPNRKAAKEQKLWRKAVKSGKYGSHDSGIQMGNRGNIDSSESQDTDLQEDIDSPVMMRRRDFQGKGKTGRPQSESFNLILFDKFKADLERLNKSKELTKRKGVRRTNSDLGSQRLYNWDVKNHYRRSPCVIGARNATQWVLPHSNEKVLRKLITEHRRPQLRRSMSQPLGLDELPSFVRRSSAAKCLTMSEDEQNLQGRQAEDEIMSDSECSTASFTERKKISELSLGEETAILAEAVWDHVSMEPSELPFRAGDVIEVLDTRDKDWWWGARGQNCGYFPSVFVRLRVSQEDTVEDCLAAMAKGSKNSSHLRRGKSISLLSNDQVRSGVVRELLNTERDFVNVLRNVKECFIFECRRRTDMFSPAQTNAIFSNLEDLLVFQEKFLKDLEGKVDCESPHKSCVGEIFLNHSSGFRMYSEYCNSHPMAIATLQELYQNERYVNFFETCRLKRSLIEIPLDGYLLTPVQRICKYPLQLAELLKYTKPDHPDFEMVGKALETMRSVAMLINERKRKMESLEKLAAWQQRVEGWEGEDLIETSSQLIHQGDVVRITSGMWTSNVTLFLFDHQIVYCKKDLIKRNTYIYKGRIFLDTSEVIDIPDGKDQQLGVTVRHGLKIYCCSKEKWVLFCCRSAGDKAKWLEAFAEEKKLVTQDREGNLNLPPAAKELARMAARTKKGPPVKLTGKNNKIGSGEFSSRNVRLGTPKAKIGRRMGNWFTFGGGKSPKMTFQRDI